MGDHGTIHSEHRLLCKNDIFFSTGGQPYEKNHLFSNSLQMQGSLCKFSCLDHVQLQSYRVFAILARILFKTFLKCFIYQESDMVSH